MSEVEERLIRERRKPKPEGEEPATKEAEMKKAGTKARVRKAAKKVVKARASAKAPAKRAASTNARTPAPAKIDVVRQVADMMARPNGASMDEMVKATGIKAHPMRAKIKLARDRLGYITTAPYKGNGYRYYATPPKKAEG